MTDAVLNIGTNTQELTSEFRVISQQISASVKQIEATISAQLGKAERSINDFARTANKLSAEQLKAAASSNRAADAIKDSGQEAKKATGSYTATVKAVTALAQAFDTVADRAFNALGVIASGAGAYLGARSSAASLERANEGLISSTIRLASAYVTVRGAFRSFVDLIGTGARFEQQRIQLQALFNSAAQGSAAFDWIRSVPIQAQGFTDGLIQLRNFGVDNLRQSLLALNDLVIKTGDEQGKLARIARQLGQGFAQNALRAEELNSLVDNGVPIFELLSKAMGVSAGEIRQLASESKIGRDEIRLLFEEIAKSSAGAAESQLDTFGGLITTLQRQFSEFVNLIAESGIFDFVKENVREFLAEIQRLKDTGQLRQIAQNISDALVGVGEGVVALITQLLQSLQKLSADGSLARFGRTFGDFLEAAAPLLGAITDQIGFLIASFIRLKTVGAIFSVVFNAALIIGTVAAVIKYRAAILAAIQATIAYGGALATATAGATGFAGALNFLAVSIGRTVLALSGAIALTAGFAAGYYLANLRVQRQIELQKQLQREIEADTKVTKEFLAIRQELNKIQDVNADNQIASLFKLRNLGQITDFEALERAREILAVAVETNSKRIELEEQRAAVESRIQELSVKREEKRVQNIIDIDKRLLTGRAQARQQTIADAQKAIDSIERAEAQSAKRIIEIQKQITDERRDLNNAIFDAEQEGRSEFSQRLQAQLEIQRQLTEAKKQNQAATEAQTEEERAAALEAANAATERAKELSQDIDSTTQRISLLKEIQSVREQTLQAEQQAIEAEQRQREINKKSLQETIELQKIQLSELEQALKRLNRDAEQIKLDLETKKAEEDLRNIQLQLEQINRLARVNLQLQAGSARPGFATGGPVFGKAGLDAINARLTAGEFVIQKSAVQRYGMAFLHAINSMRLPALKIPQYNIPIARSPVGRTHFATGGDVPRGGEVHTFRFVAPDGDTADLFGDRRALTVLNKAMAGFVRAGG